MINKEKKLVNDFAENLNEAWCKLYAKDFPVIGNFLIYQEKTNKIKFKLYFEDGTIVIARYYGGGDSDNGLEMDDPFYEEFYELDFKIEKIIERGRTFNCGEKEFISLNYHNFFCNFEPVEEE